VRLRLSSEASGEIFAEITDENPDTAEKITAALPLSGVANTWGDEIYFSVSLSIGSENSREVVEEGEVAFWPESPCICIFFGKTPASRGDELRAASPVNVFARIEGDLSSLKKVKPGDRVTLERA
jgi:hypothetical protein